MLWRCTSCSHRNRGRDLVCAQCGSPKDGTESYEMPGDVSGAVTDEKLLAIARGGANWSCRYCGSDVRRRDGACGRCGAGEVAAAGAVVAARSRPRSLWPYALAAVVATLFVVVLLGVAARRPRRPPAAYTAPPEAPAFVDVDAVVTARSWQRKITVERHQLWPFEGFAETKPTDAVEVKELGQRVHHHDSVLDGYDTQTWTEQVADGFDTQSYTTTEACGQTCVPRPQNCSPVCTPNKNGFATCRNVCTGGGQSCSTKYCTVTKQKQVPRTKSVIKSKQVPRYRKEPRFAAYFGWRALAWRAVRTLDKAGEGAPAWPSDEEVALLENERKLAFETYGVTLAYDGKTLTHAPRSEAAFAGFAVGSKHRVRIPRFGVPELLGPTVASDAASD